MGASASLASLELLESNKSQLQRKRLAKNLKDLSKPLWDLEKVGDIRISGCVLAVELVRDWKTRQPFDLAEQAGIRVCSGMQKLGVLTRPIGNVIVVMPPFCTTKQQIEKIFNALYKSILVGL